MHDADGAITARRVLKNGAIIAGAVSVDRADEGGRP
jgi:hypothetical protein